MKKQCTKCKEEKNEKDFSLTKIRGRMLRRSWCDSCMREYYKAYSEAKRRGVLSSENQGSAAMQINSLNELFVDHLRDMYNMETQITKALPKMVKYASSAELKNAFEEHLEETEKQVERLEQIFEKLGGRARGKKCYGIQGIIEEGGEFLDKDIEEDVRDAALIGAAQRVEHYEMAVYGCARTWAEQLGLHDVAELLQESLNEEKAADQKLTELAEASINQEATVGSAQETAPTARRKRTR